MSKDQTSPDTSSVTSLPESGDGHSQSNSPGGIQLDLFGPAVSHASPSAPPGSEGENPTSDTSGLSSSVSSRSANLQLSLENRLRQDLAVNGSPEYELTWKQWGMESGLPICALRASGHRISGSDSIGWPTPTATERQNDTSATPSEATLERFQEGEINRVRKTRAPTLTTAAQVTGWPTPNAGNFNDGEDLESWESRQQRNIEKFKNGNGQGTPLSIAAQQAGWPTPQAADGGKIGSKPNFGQVGLSNHPALHGYPEREPMQKSREGDGQTTNLSGWNSPRATDGSNGGPNQSGGAWSNDVAGWRTPTSLSKGEDGHQSGNNRWVTSVMDAVRGQTQSGSPSETGSKGVLNAALPLWLQGFPSDWLMVAPVKMSRVSRLSAD